MQKSVIRIESLSSHGKYIKVENFSPEPQTGFRIAFNMFDTDGNERVDKEEFLVVSVDDCLIASLSYSSGMSILAEHSFYTDSSDNMKSKGERIELIVTCLKGKRA